MERRLFPLLFGGDLLDDVLLQFIIISGVTRRSRVKGSKIFLCLYPSLLFSKFH